MWENDVFKVFLAISGKTFDNKISQFRFKIYPLVLCQNRRDVLNWDSLESLVMLTICTHEDWVRVVTYIANWTDFGCPILAFAYLLPGQDNR